MTQAGGRDDRHSRSVLFPGIGEEGRRRIARLLDRLRRGRGRRGGGGRVGGARGRSAGSRLIDRDVVEESNLARQFLFDAEDAARVSRQGGAAAARTPAGDRRRARSVRGSWPISTHSNARELLAGHDASSTRRTTSRRGSSFPTPPGPWDCRPSTPRASARRVSSPSPRRGGLRACAATSRRFRPRAPGRHATRPGSSRRLPPLVAAIAMTEALRLAVGGAASRGVLAS